MRACLCVRMDTTDHIQESLPGWVNTRQREGTPLRGCEQFPRPCAKHSITHSISITHNGCDQCSRTAAYTPCQRKDGVIPHAACCNLHLCTHSLCYILDTDYTSTRPLLYTGESKGLLTSPLHGPQQSSPTKCMVLMPCYYLATNAMPHVLP